jgi:hypothetical protein
MTAAKRNATTRRDITLPDELKIDYETIRRERRAAREAKMN